MSTITGFKSTDIELRSKVEPSTVEYIGPKRQGLDVVSWQGAYLVQSGTTLSTSTESFIGITSISSTARVGDLLKIGSEYSSIVSLSTDIAEVAHNFVGSVTSQAYELYRFTILKTDSSGGLIPGVGYDSPPLNGIMGFAEVGGTVTVNSATAETLTFASLSSDVDVGDYVHLQGFIDSNSYQMRRITEINSNTVTIDEPFATVTLATQRAWILRRVPVKTTANGAAVIAAIEPGSGEAYPLSVDAFGTGGLYVTAYQSGTWNVGVSSLPNEGQQTMANSISVAIASNQSAVPISDGGSTITVDGTVAATQSGTWTVGLSTDATGIADGRKTVTTAATAETLASSTACKWVTIQALNSNTGVAVVGGSTVVAASGTRRGAALFPNDTITLQIDNLVDVYVDVTVSGEGVSYIYGT